jgi:hypothetical protein
MMNGLLDFLTSSSVIAQVNTLSVGGAKMMRQPRVWGKVTAIPCCIVNLKW